MDLDIYRHVNNVVFYSWIDTAVIGWLVEKKLLVTANPEVVCFVVESGCRYAAPVHFPQTVSVGLLIEHLGTSSIRYRIGIFVDGSKNAAAEGHFVHVCVDAQTHRAVPIPTHWRTALEALTTSN